MEALNIEFKTQDIGSTRRTSVIEKQSIIFEEETDDSLSREQKISYVSQDGSPN